MELNVFKNFHLSLEMIIVGYSQKIAEHINPKLICRVGLKYDSGHIILQWLDDLDKMFCSCFFLHNW